LHDQSPSAAKSSRSAADRLIVVDTNERRFDEPEISSPNMEAVTFNAKREESEVKDH